ncbi:MAG: hypothetical protein K0S71_1964 [Clostridia bacterium]|jgi:YQGE family putative transporter|nr:hypothetical protein [Clostridia bacterium]
MCKKAKILLIVSGLFTFAMGLSNVFVNIFLWKKSNDFMIIAKYNLIHYIFIPITFLIAGWLAKKKNGIWSLRIGIASFMLFFVFILFIKDRMTEYIYPLGCLLGIASGFYWLAFHMLSFDFTSINNRDTFNGLNGSIVGAVNAAAPFTAAYIIERSRNTFGYTIVFSISLAVFAVLILISLLLKSERYGEKIAFKKIFITANKEWKLLRNAFSLWGLRDVVMLFLINILIYQTTGSEMALGKLTFFSFLLVSLSCMLQQKIIKPRRRVFSITLGASAMFIAVIGLVVKIDYMFLIWYIFIDAAFIPFFTVPMSSAAFNLLSRSHEEEYRTEYIISKEFALNTGRIISTSILILLLTFFKNPRLLNYFLLFIGSAQLGALFFLRKIKTWDL